MPGRFHPPYIVLAKPSGGDPSVLVPIKGFFGALRLDRLLDRGILTFRGGRLWSLWAKVGAVGSAKRCPRQADRCAQRIVHKSTALVAAVNNQAASKTEFSSKLKNPKAAVRASRR